VFEIGVLRRMFGAKRDEVTREWRKVHNEEIQDLYSSPNIVQVKKIEKNKVGGACSSDGEGRDVYRGLMGKPEGKRPLVRSRCRWEYNIKMGLQEVGCGGMAGLSWLRIEAGGGHI
jgi:hypothetical protein